MTQAEATELLVPSLYVRVYRAVVVYDTGILRSLIIREGISPHFHMIINAREFPHYT